ncbi:Maf family protein [Akkermansiaceae bacterium]|nr:Maf family protein [Akkermansiaceae bacterium]
MISFSETAASEPRLILASGSPRRRDLLREAGLEPMVIPPDVEEFGAGAFPPRELCLTNARLKGLAISVNYPDDYVIASDTVVALDGVVYGKPESEEEAAFNLREFRGRVHEVMTGVIILQGERICEFVETSFVKFKEFDGSVIQSYLSKVPVLDKAGGYAIQDHGEWLVESIEGDYHNIVGLPLTKVLAQLAQMGFPLPKE